VSHVKQAASGLSEEAQEAECRAYFLRSVAPRGVEFGGIISDPAVSASKKHFAKRKGGRELLAKVRPGDHIIFNRFDRAFRSMQDFCAVYYALTKNDKDSVRIHILDAPWDLSTANGNAMLQLMSVFAEWSSRITSERNRSVARYCKSIGRKCSKHVPFGFKGEFRPVTGLDGNKTLKIFCVPNFEERDVMCEVVYAQEFLHIGHEVRLSRIAHVAATRVWGPDKSLWSRRFNPSSIRRVRAAFWSIVWSEGAGWIKDLRLRRIAENRYKKHQADAAEQNHSSTGLGFQPGDAGSSSAPADGSRSSAQAS